MAVRKRTAVLATALGLLVPTMLATSAAAATRVDAISAGLTQVNLLNINDFHGRIDSGSIDGTLGLQVACTIEGAKTALGDDKTVFLSAGDNTGASIFASTIANDEPTIAYLNALQLKATAVGNHEFDTGFGDLTTRLTGLANFDYLGANVSRNGAPALKEYSLQTVNGVRVGVIGAVTQETPSLVSPTGVTGLVFGDPVAAVNRVADQLTDGNQANGEADILVAEIHDGPSAADSLAARVAADASFAKIVNQTSPKVSVIFNGHTHLAYTWDGPTTSGTRSVSQSGSYGAFVGQVQLGYDPATRTVKEYRTTNLSTATANLAACAGDPQYVAAKAIVTNAIASAKVLGEKPVAKVTADVTTAFKDATPVNGIYTGKVRDDRGRESTLGNMVAQAWLDEVNVPGRPGADIGIQNPGGIRAELYYKASGSEGDGVVTYAEAAGINPFANTLQTIDITGSQFKTVLEQQWQPAGSARPFLAMGLSDNVTYTFDESRPSGDRVTSITVDGRPIDAKAIYTVASGSFLIAGGDNFTVLQQGTNSKDSGLIDTDAFVNWLSAHKTVSPSYVKHGVRVQVAGDVKPGKTVTVTVEGLDLTSLGAPANTELSLVSDGKLIAKTPVQTVHLAGTPTRDGKATLSFKVTGRGWNPSQDKPFTLVAQPSGTTIPLWSISK